MADLHALESLIPQLAHHQTRHKARKQIEEMGPEAAPRLLPLLSDDTLPSNMRWAVLSLCASWRYREAAPALLALARDDRGLYNEALRALQTITGFDIGDDLEEWERALADPDGYAARQATGDQSPESEEDEEEEENEEEAYNLFRRALADLTSEFRWEDEGYLYMRFELPGGRKQQMVATFHATDPSGNQMATVYTECGPAEPQIRELIRRRNVTVKYGKFVLDGEGDDQKVVMREMIPIHHLTVELIRELVPSMANDADSLENELTHSDRI
jgi:hypothetical protein